jgi:hypothetical protein
MISGFNTDVRHDGRLYHVQTEDRGREHPVLESLVFVGGTIVAKKLTPYADHLSQGATEEMIASLLKRQHQVIIAAIKAGRIQDLISRSIKDRTAGSPSVAAAGESVVVPETAKESQFEPSRDMRVPAASAPDASGESVVDPGEPAPTSARLPGRKRSDTSPGKATTGGLDLDAVILDYVKRSSEMERLDLKVLSPSVFTAGKTISLKVHVSRASAVEVDAVVTVKVIGTAFKPQVFASRTGGEGVATFSISLPLFTAGTAAIVIEAKSHRGRGELKHLIRRA